SSGNLLLLEESRSAGRDVIFKDGLRCDVGLVGVAELSGIELTVGVGRRIVGRFREFKSTRLAAGKVIDADLRQAVFALVGDKVILEEVCAIEHDVGPVGNDFLPICAAGIGDRGLDQAEVAARVVDAYVEGISVVVGVVLDLVFTRLQNLPIG